MAKDGIDGTGRPATAELLGGRYRLDELIGRGGMAAVWRATDIEFQRQVAVKRLHARHVDDAEFAERFRREARVVARLSHSHLVRMLDAGDDESGPYLVLELVEGETLKQRLARLGPLDPSEAARIVAQVADALDYAHGQGIVHRDIKSQNVLLSNDGTAKLADFGIARLLEADAEPSLTQTDMMVGSADYIAPEQAEGGVIDARTDIYSLGIVLYEALVGRLPFAGEGFVAVAVKHVNETLPDPREISSSVPAGLAAVAMRAAAKEPDDRFPDAASMAAALRGDARGATAVHPLGVLGSATTTRARRRAARSSRAAKGIAAALSVIALVAAGIAGMTLLGGDDVPEQPALEPIAIAAVSDLDPEGDGSERPDLTAFALGAEGAWTSERYASADFGNLGKTGVGLVLSLDRPSEVRELRLTSPSDGAAFSVLGPAGAGGERGRLGGGRTAAGAQVVPLSEAPPVEELVLWFTELAPAEDGGFAAAVEQVRVRGVANPNG